MNQLVRGGKRRYPQKYQYRDSRDVLKEEMFRLFIRYGYMGTSIKALCSSDKALQSVLYYHFRSKKELMLSVLEEFLAECTERMAAMALLGRIEDPRERLRLHYLWLMLYLRGHAELGRFYYRLCNFEMDDLQCEADNCVENLHQSCMKMPLICIQELLCSNHDSGEVQTLLRRYLLLLRWSCLELISEDGHPAISVLEANWRLFCRMAIDKC